MSTPIFADPAIPSATIIGTILQVVLAVLAHLSDWLLLHALLFGAMMLSAIAGYLYAHGAARGYPAAATGGAYVGGICGVFGVTLSIVLGDTDPGLLVQNCIIFTVAGVVGGLFGQFAAGRNPMAT